MQKQRAQGVHTAADAYRWPRTRRVPRARGTHRRLLYLNVLLCMYYYQHIQSSLCIASFADRGPGYYKVMGRDEYPYEIDDVFDESS